MTYINRSVFIRKLYFCMIIALSSFLLIPPHIANADINLNTPEENTTNENVSTRIFGGRPVSEGERTFQVALLGRDSGGEFLLCGGSIIADSWVLTAAHCFTDVDISTVQVLSDTQDLSRGGERHTIARVVLHPNFSPGLPVFEGDDIALVNIVGSFSSHLERLKLATRSIMSSLVTPGVEGTVSGWGLTEQGILPDLLIEVKNTIISDEECERQLRNDFNNQSINLNGPAIICGDDTNRSSCAGDSGGPFTISNGGETYSIGIVSFGPNDCMGLSANTETANYIDFVKEHVDIDTGGGNGNGTVLTKDNPILVSGQRGERKFFTFTLPSDVSKYTVSISGGSGDADLYVRQGAAPTDFIFDCRPYKDGNFESCSDNSPSPGTYHVMLKGYRAFSGVTLELQYDTAGGVANCPSDHELVTGFVENDGSTILGGDYYFAQSGLHSFINAGNPIRMSLYKRRSRWVRVRSSSDAIKYQGRRGYYILLVKGTPGTAFQICAKTP